MIAEGFLTYKSARTPWYFWEPDSPTFTTVLFSAILMLLSHQMTAMIFDVSLGLKRRGEAKSRHLGILLLTWKSSPVAVLNALSSKQLASRQSDSELFEEREGLREKGFLRTGTALTLLLLLLIVPLLDVGTLVLILERQEQLTFKEAGFGKVQLGLRENLQPLPVERVSTTCVAPVIKAGPHDEILSTFQLCTLPMSSKRSSFEKDELTLRLYIYGENTLFVNILANEISITRRVGGGLVNAKSTYRLRVNISKPSAEKLSAETFRVLSAECTNIKNSSKSLGELEDDFDLLIWKTASCTFSKNISTVQDLNQHLAEVVTNIISRVTFVSSTTFELDPVRSTEFGTVQLPKAIDAGNIVFINRRRRNVGLGILAMATVVIIGVRLFGSLLLQNDVSKAIDLLVKSHLGIDPSCSLLIDNKLIRFGNKKQNGQKESLWVQSRTSS